MIIMKDKSMLSYLPVPGRKVANCISSLFSLPAKNQKGSKNAIYTRDKRTSSVCLSNNAKCARFGKSTTSP